MNIQTPFKDIIPPLTPDEFSLLEENVLKDGISNPLVLWGTYLIDGHNRYKIAQKHGLEYKTVQMDFNDENAAKIWIIKNQFGRRNISDVQRIKLALELKTLLSEQARERMKRKPESAMPTLAEQNYGTTRDELAKMAGVGHTNIEKVTYIQRYGTDEINKQLDEGKLSINKAHQITVASIPPKKPGRPTTLKPVEKQPVPTPIAITEKSCTVCGRILPVEKFYPTKVGLNGPCKQCYNAKQSYGISPTIREDIGAIQRASDYLTDTERVMEYSIEDVIVPITEEMHRLIRIIDTETQNHADLIKDPGNKEALLKALEVGVSQIQSKIKDLAR